MITHDFCCVGIVTSSWSVQLASSYLASVGVAS